MTDKTTLTEEQRKAFYAHLAEIGMPAPDINDLRGKVDKRLGMIDAQTKSRDTLQAQITALDTKILDALFEVAAAIRQRFELSQELSDVYGRLQGIGVYLPGRSELPWGEVPCSNPVLVMQAYLTRFAKMFDYTQAPEKEARLDWFERRKF
jgi:hypothetical protein